MSRRVSVSRAARLTCLAGIAVMLLSCQSFREASGAAKLAPDEFLVLTKSPLIIPPDFHLRPPIPGAPDRNRGTAADVARTALFGQNPQTAAAALPGNFSAQERYLLARSGGSVADPAIRQAISSDSGLTDQGLDFAQGIIDPAGAAAAPGRVAAAPITPPTTTAAPVRPATATPAPPAVIATRTAPASAAAAPAPAVIVASTRPVAPAAAPVKAAQPDLATAPALLQIGSYTSEARANDAWQIFRARHAASIGALRGDVQAANIPDRGTLYRLRVGPFADRTAALAACEMLKAEGGACLVAAP